MALLAAAAWLAGGSTGWALEGKVLAIDGPIFSLGDVIMIDAATGQRTDLTTGGGIWGPAFSPDGTRIAFTKGDKVYMMDNDGGNLEELCSGGQPSWTTTGYIYFPSSSTQTSRINLTTRVVDVAATWSGVDAGGVYVNLDGTHGAASVPAWSVCKFDLTTGQAVDFGGGCQGSISPDGNYVTRNLSSHVECLIHNFSDGSTHQTIWAPGGVSANKQRWSRNFDDYIVYTAENYNPVHCYVYQVSTNTHHKIAEFGDPHDFWLGPLPTAGPSAPRIASAPAGTGYVGVQYVYVVAASGDPTPELSVTGCPAWLTWDAGTRTLSGTPSASDLGPTGTITVTATNSQGTDTQAFSIEVTDADPGLVLWWKFDETGVTTASDSAGSNPGTVSGGGVWQPSGGRIDGALEFDGTDDCVESATDVAFSEASTTSFTVTAWSKRGPGGTGERFICDRVGDTVDFVNLYRVDDTAYFRIRGTGGGMPTVSAANALSENTWTHVAGVRDRGDSTLKLYVDGTLAATVGDDATGDISPRIRVGAHATAGLHWNGLIDDLRVYTRALSPGEVQAVYEEAAAGPRAPTITSEAVTSAMVNVSYSYTLAASGDPAPTFTVTGLPGWLSSSTDTISGTPGTAHVGTTGTITVTAANSEGTATQEFQITVTPDPTAPSITITSPAGGDVWHVGTTQRIEWTTANLDNIVILYSTDNAQTLTAVTDDTFFLGDADWGSYPWLVPDAPSTECLVLVRGYMGAAPTWSGVFEIRSVTDDDADGMDDGWEGRHFDGTSRDGAGDFDNDGCTDLEEFLGGTDPTDAKDPGGAGWTTSPGAGCVPVPASAPAALLVLATGLAALRRAWRGGGFSRSGG
jgi:hypothetical protein